MDDWGVIRDANGKPVAQCSIAFIDDACLQAHRNAGTDPTQEAASLLAAAPDLLLACREALDSLEYVEQHMPGQTGYGVRQERIAKLRAALAKATTQVAPPAGDPAKPDACFGYDGLELAWCAAGSQAGERVVYTTDVASGFTADDVRRLQVWWPMAAAWLEAKPKPADEIKG